MERDALLLRLRPNNINGGIDDGGQIHAFEIELQFARHDTGQVEQRLDQACLRLGVSLNSGKGMRGPIGR